MLTLTRREGESLILSIDGMEPIKIKLARISGSHQARISIDAPKAVSIQREEIADREEVAGD